MGLANGGAEGRRNVNDMLGKLSCFSPQRVRYAHHTSLRLSWQKLRQAETDLERDLLNANLERLTTQERELRSRIEDVLRDTDARPSDHKHASDGSGSLKPVNGHAAPEANGVSGDANGVRTKVNGVGAETKKGKKRKADAQ